MRHLVAAADTDFQWVRLHTRLQVRAREWDDAGRDESLLARGRELEAATHWLTESALMSEREVSALQVAYLEAARQREAAEAERTRELSARTLARQLAAQSELVRGSDVESVRTSVLLAAESVEQWPSVEGDRALRRGLALLSRRPVQRIRHPGGYVALARDGRRRDLRQGQVGLDLGPRAAGAWRAAAATPRCAVAVRPRRAGVAVAADTAARLARRRRRGRGIDCGAPPVAVASPATSSPWPSRHDPPVAARGRGARAAPAVRAR